ncbi:MAG TPA: glycosyltransferase [Mycobacteriales bacterium]|nr:glycosyltransferase [Mycobacteriales bacterium]
MSVLIPARNEARRIGACLQPLVNHPDIAEVVVVDDESSDDTAAIAASCGATVVHGTPPPRGWVGKPWALHQGLAQVSGPWVLTLDADTRAGADLVRAAVAAALERGDDLLSMAGRYRCDSALEQALHGSMLATLVYRFGPPGTRHRPRPSRTLVNGQCLLFRKEALLRAGGFAAAGPHLTDDIALARDLARRGWRIGMVDAAALLEVDMHDSARSVWREWGRSLPMADVTTRPRALADTLTLGVTMALPVWRLLLGRPTPTDWALLATRCALVAGLWRSYRRPGPGLVLSALADPLVVARLAYGIWRPSRRWRGRTYPVTAAAVAATGGRGGTSTR